MFTTGLNNKGYVAFKLGNKIIFEVEDVEPQVGDVVNSRGKEYTITKIKAVQNLRFCTVTPVVL